MGELISVIVPAYNVEPYLENCLISVVRQSYPDIEILVVDDGSTDNTLQIACRCKETFPDQIRVIHTENQGVTMARFEGIKQARGKWIGFVDGDDEIEPDMYERLIKNAEKYKADISHCGHQTIVNGGERIHYFFNTGRLIEQNWLEGLMDLFVGSVEPGLWSKVYRKDMLDNLLDMGIMDTSIKYNEDLLMNYYLFRQSDKSVYEDFCGYHYMAHSSSVTRKTFRIEKIMDPVRVWRTILEDASPEIKDTVWRKYLNACINAYTSLYGKEQYRKEADNCRDILRNNRAKLNLLSRNEKIKYIMLLVSPVVYNRIRQFYVKYFQKKIYE